LQIKPETTGKRKPLKCSNNMQGRTDEELIEILKNGNGSQKREAFDCLYLRYAEPLTQYFRFALQKNNDKAGDFLHDLFLKIWENPEKFDTSQQFKPWVYRVAANMCKNDYRRLTVAGKFRFHVLQTSVHYYQPDENENRLNKCIKKLSREKRSLIVLRFKLNLSIKEIAEISECPEGTVKSRLFYSIKELSKFYKS
jgi:RNA polymerase sigma-70 factor, ECF subfamily